MKKNSSPEVNERIEKKNIAKNVKGIEVWGKVLDELKSRGRMAVYAYLLDTKLIELGSNQVGIVFKNNGCKMLVEKSENLEVIEECLRECLGKEVRVKCFDEEDIVDTGKNDEEDKLVEKAQDFAQKFDVEVNIIDE